MRSDRRLPPRLPLAVLRALLLRAERHEVLSEVEREYAARAESQGRRAADRWLWRQALVSAPVLVRRSWWREWSGFEPHADKYNPGGSMLRSWLADAHYAVRRLRARPGYSLIAALTLALGIGGTAAVYGIARGLLFEPLPFTNEREVGAFWKKTDWSEEEFLHMRGRFPGFSQVALYRFRNLRLQDGDAPVRLVPSVIASAELFDVLGAPPVLGSGFRAAEEAQGAEPGVVLSFGLWQEMGGDASVMGRRLVLDGTSSTVIGVMPPGFWFPDPTVRLWVQVPLRAENRTFNSTLVGRVAPGNDVRSLEVPIAQLTAMLDERFDYPAQWDKAVDPRITPIRDDMIGTMRPALLATLGAMALILLIACANVAALMLGQVDARASELAVRLALGANRRRLTQQLVVETMFIGTAAGVLGALLAWGGFRVLARALPLGAWAESTAPDWTVFASAMAIAVAAALLVVLVPSLSLWRGDLRAILSPVRTGGLQGRGGRLESGLVVAEVALAVLIASGAALLARSVANLYALDPGVRAEGVGVVDVMLGGGGPQQRETINQLTEALAALPGVRSVGAVQTLPLQGGGYNVALDIEGQPDTDGMTTEFRTVTPGYLETMGFELIEGRTITSEDRSDTERVVVINEALAEKYFAGVSPIGQGLLGESDEADRVVGVVADAAERWLIDDAVPVRYVPIAQMPWVDPPQSLVLRAAPGADPSALLDAARRTVERVAPAVAVRSTTTMSRVLATAVGPARQVMSLLSLLTGLALTLGAVGIYGVIAHFAARRRREWAIRIALGLPGSRAVTRVVGHAVLLVAVGAVLGVIAAAGLARLLSSFLYGVRPVDPIAFMAAAAALLAVGVLAALVPAHRAGRTDPAIVLREQ